MYVISIKYLLSCYQRLGKFNAIVCKISQPFVTYLIYTSQHSDVTHIVPTVSHVKKCD